MSKLYEETIQLLKSTDKKQKQIAADTGLGERWIGRLKDGDFQDPGVNKIERLHNYLVDRKKQQQS